MERANLLVVRKVEIHGIKGRSSGIFSYRAAHDGRKISTTVAHDQHLKRARNLLQKLVFNRLWRHVVAGAQDNQILQAASYGPVPRGIHFALIAGVEPT